MKLSQMKARQSAEAIAIMAPYAGNLMRNKIVAEFFTKYANKELSIQLALSGIMDMLPVFLRENFDDVIGILSVLSDKAAAEIEDMTFVELVATIKNSFDGELLKLFT